MSDFTPLEKAALLSIFAESPDLQATLEEQFRRARVVEREDSGAGFFTTIEVPADAEPVRVSNVLGLQTGAKIEGLEHGLGFVLFLKNGRLDLLEGYTFGPENTVGLNLTDLTFTVFRGSEWLEGNSGSAR